MRLNVPRFKQEKLTCGPSSLQQVLAYYGNTIDLNDILKTTKMLDRGIHISNLGCSAIEQGYNAKIINLDVTYFDPTWFTFDKKKLLRKLKAEKKFCDAQIKLKKFESIVSKRIAGYIEFLEKDGKIEFRPITKNLMKSYIKKKIPVITVLSSTLQYKIKRKYEGKADDIEGDCIGHFVVISGYTRNQFIVTDPSPENTFDKSGVYRIDAGEIIHNITAWDGGILIVTR